MKLIKVGAAVLNQTPFSWDDNREHIVAALAAARADGVTALCLPELCVTGYGCEDAFHMPGLQETALDVLHELCPHTAGMVVCFGLPLLHQNALFNTVAVVADRRILGFVAKKFLAGDGIHYEPRWFKPWPAGVHEEIVVRGVSYPLGDIHFDLGGVKVGFEICEDAWVADRPGGALALRGMDVILNPSASHFAFGKIEVRKRFVIEGSRAFGVSYVYANLLGNEAGRAIFDGGAIVASGGRLVALGPRLSMADWLLTTAVVNVDATRIAQARTSSYRPRLGGSDLDCVAAEFSWPALKPQPPVPPVGPAGWEAGAHVKEEELARAEALALLDYLRKSKAYGFVVSLSGGADSAAITCMIALVVAFGVRELGVEGLRRKLGHIPAVRDAAGDREIIRALCTCVYQSTRNSGPVTRSAARNVAEAVGARFLELDVDAIVESYQRIVGAGIGRELTWDRDDVALQNIQARVRAPGVWMLANLENKLLVATSNRSEAAVGYATMDGDTAGGLSPIAGIDKNYLRRWLRWLEEEGPEGVGAIPALAAINAQQPTAELRPPGAAQTDEKDLMPYDVLDAVERAAIRDKQSPIEVWERVCAELPGYGAEDLGAWVERFFRLFCRNQWKRERYAPSFHLDDENLDPKTWCRFPILSGGFERELAALRARVRRPG